MRAAAASANAGLAPQHERGPPLAVDAPQSRARLAEFLAERLDVSRVAIVGLTRLPGGAIQENWALDVDVDFQRHAWVLRSDAAARVSSSLTRPQEYAALGVAFAAGVPVARPIVLGDAAVFAREFFVTARAEGTAAAFRLVKDDALVSDRRRLAVSLGRAMGRLHRVVPPHGGLQALPAPPTKAPAAATIGRLRAQLDALAADANAHGEHFSAAWPTLEWGLRWCECNAPEHESVSFTHGDLRTGNYLVAANEVSAVLDWEFAGWGNPMADIGWLFAKCWRFGRNDRRCGGVGTDESFFKGYLSEGAVLDIAQITFWELVAHLRWAVIALEQVARHRSGRQRSLELALTGHLVSALEREILLATGQSA